MKKIEKDFLGRLVQKDIMGNSIIIPTNSLSMTDQIEFMKVPNGTLLRHEEWPGGQMKIFREQPVQYSPPNNLYNSSPQRPPELSDEISPTMSASEAQRLRDRERVQKNDLDRRRLLISGSSFARPSFEEKAAKEQFLDYKEFAKSLINSPYVKWREMPGVDCLLEQFVEAISIELGVDKQEAAKVAFKMEDLGFLLMRKAFDSPDDFTVAIEKSLLFG